MRVVFMAKSKRSAARALAWLVAQRLRGGRRGGLRAGRVDRWTSSAWTSWPREHGLPLVSEAELYEAAEPRRAGRRGPGGVLPVLEPHPRAADLARPDRLPEPPPRAAARLPRRRAATTSRSSRGCAEWGVSCHFVDARIDTGDLVEVERFPIDPDAETALSLDVLSQERLLGLFQRVIGARWRARSCRASRRARAATCRAPSSRSCAWCGRATTWSASCAPSGTRPGPAR